MIGIVLIGIAELIANGMPSGAYIFSEPRVKSGVGATTPEEERRGCVVLTPNERGLLNIYQRSLLRGSASEGVIAFDYGAKTVKFGLGLDEAEARQILKDINQQLAEKI